MRAGCCRSEKKKGAHDSQASMVDGNPVQPARPEQIDCPCPLRTGKCSSDLDGVTSSAHDRQAPTTRIG